MVGKKKRKRPTRETKVLRHEVEALGNDNAALWRAADARKVECLALVAEKALTRCQLADAKKREEALTQEKQKLTLDNRELQEAREKLIVERDKCLSSLREGKQIVNNLVEKEETLTLQYDEMKARCEFLARRLIAEEDNVSKFSGQLNEAEKRVAGAMLLVELGDADRRTHLARIEELERKCDELQKRLDQRGQQLNASNTELKRMGSHLLIVVGNVLDRKPPFEPSVEKP